MSQDKHQWMISTPTFKLIFASSLPFLPAILSLLVFDLLETWLLSKHCAIHMAAFTMSIPLVLVLSGLAIALSIATNSWICRTKTENNQSIEQHCHRALWVSASITLLLSCIGIYALDVYLKTDTGIANGELNLALEYSQLRLFGWATLVMIWVTNGIMRTLGHLKRASILLLLWLTTKAALTFILVSGQFRFNLMETDGALIASAYSHLVTDTLFALIGLTQLYARVLNGRRIHWFKLRWIHTLKQLSIVGTNASLQQLLTPLSIAAITTFVALFTSESLPILSILFRFEAFSLLVPFIFTASLPGILATNWWEGHLSRVRSLIIRSFFVIFAVQTLLALTLFANAEEIATWLTSSSSLTPEATQYLSTVPISFTFVGCAVLLQSFLNAIGKPVSASLLALKHRILVTLISAFIGISLMKIEGLFYAMTLTNLASGIFVFYHAKRIFWQHNSTEKLRQIPTGHDLLQHSRQPT